MHARAAAGLLLAMPGAVYLYQGEELGLPEWLDMPDDARQDPVFANTGGVRKGRDGCRVPQPWTADPAGSHGFSPTDRPAAAPWLPQPADWGSFAADLQDGDDTSMLELYRRLVDRRRTLLTADDAELVDVTDDVIAMWRGPVLVVCNTGAEPIDVALAVGLRAVVTTDASVGADGGSTVPGDTTVWFAP